MGSRPTPDSFAALPINEESIGNTRKSARSSVGNLIYLRCLRDSRGAGAFGRRHLGFPGRCTARYDESESCCSKNSVQAGKLRISLCRQCTSERSAIQPCVPSHGRYSPARPCNLTKGEHESALVALGKSSIEIGCSQFRILKTLEQPAFLRHRRRDCATFVSCPAFAFHNPSNTALLS